MFKRKTVNNQSIEWLALSWEQDFNPGDHEFIISIEIILFFITMHLVFNIYAVVEKINTTEHCMVTFW
jgi:hypothetical protein